MKPDESIPSIPHPLQGLKRVEHYALYLINGMAAAGSGCPSDGDIDYAIDVAERLFGAERVHLAPALRPGLDELLELGQGL